MLFSILDSSPLRTPPPIHTPGGETLQRLTSSAPEENHRKTRKYINHRYIIPQISKHWVITFAFFFFCPENQAHSMISLLTDSFGLSVASICAPVNTIHFLPARMSSFTLSCPWRTNQKSSRYFFTWSAWHRKHPPHSKFTAVAHSQFTPRPTDKPIKTGLSTSPGWRGSEMPNQVPVRWMFVEVSHIIRVKEWIKRRGVHFKRRDRIKWQFTNVFMFAQTYRGFNFPQWIKQCKEL